MSSPLNKVFPPNKLGLFIFLWGEIKKMSKIYLNDFKKWPFIVQFFSSLSLWSIIPPPLFQTLQTPETNRHEQKRFLSMLFIYLQPWLGWPLGVEVRTVFLKSWKQFSLHTGRISSSGLNITRMEIYEL